MEETFKLTRSADAIAGGAGDDTVVAPAHNAYLQDHDVLDLGAGRDTLIMERTDFLGLHASKLAGASGLDVIDMSAASELRFAGDDALLAQADDGTVRLVWGAAPLFLDLRTVSDGAGYLLDGAGPVSLADIDQAVRLADGPGGAVRGGLLSDTLRGGDGDDTLSGGAGNDALEGGAGDDSLSGGAGHDDLRAGAGRDTVSGGAGFDLISSGTGAARLSGGADADVFVIRQGAAATVTDFDPDDPYERIDLRGIPGLTFAAMTVSDTADGARIEIDDTTSLLLEGIAADAVVADLFALPGEEMASLAEGLGVAADFFFTGEADYFQGGAGAQIFELTGSFGKLSAEDRFFGAGGVDTLRVDGADRSLSIAKLAGMSGVEVIDLSGATGSHRVVVDPQMRAQADDGVLTIRHGGSLLTLDAIAPAGTVVVEGAGEVSLRSEDGQAVAVSDAIGGRIAGGDSPDRIDGGARADHLDGGIGDDTLSDGAGDDRLIGGEGDDTFLLSGLGDVTVTGGAGHDTYVIAPGAGRITITDLDTTDYLERIDLSALAGITKRSDVDLRIEGGDVLIAGEGLDLVLEGAAGARFGVDDFLVAGQRDDRFLIEADAPLSALQALLHDAPDGTVIRLAAGTYDFTAPLRIDRSNITVKGAGEGETVFVNRIADEDIGNAEAHLFLVMPDDIERPLGLLAGDVAKGARRFELEDGHGMEAGDLLFVNQPNDDEWLAETGNTGWTPIYTGREEGIWLREFRSRIESVDGNTVTLAEATPYAFDAGIAVARQSTMLSEVHLSDFTIEGRWGAPDPYDFTNTMEDWANTTALEFDSVENSSMRRITTIDLPSHAFRFQRAHESEGHDLTAIGAFNKAGSNGVHFTLVESFSNTLTGITSMGSRHAVEFSSYSAEHYNDVQVDFVDRDINFHGSPDNGNTVTVDRMVMDYPSMVFPQWRAVSPGGFPLHPYATIEDNDVTFLYAETGDRKDLITGNDAGAFLSTGFGNDQVTGGAGADTIVGGLQGDVLEGRGGSDRFVWALGDGTDTILDFEAGAGGDVLVFRGTGFTALEQLQFHRVDGRTVLKLGTYGEMRLRDLDPGQLTEANVAFEDAPAERLAIDARAVYDHLLGTSGDDRIGIQGLHLEMDDFALAAGAGDDRVVVNIRAFEGAFHTTGQYSGVDSFDFSSLESGDIAVSRGLVAQSDGGALTLLFGDAGAAIRLTAGGLGAKQTLFVDGARDLRLSGNAENAITLTDRAGGTVFGGARADEITGGAQNDRIGGGGGDDVIAGGAGADRLTGGAGRDSFVFEVPGDAFRGVDRVMDFTLGQDRVVLDIPDGLYRDGAMPAGAFSGSGAPRDRGDRVIYDGETGLLSIDLDGTGPAGATAIARFEGAPDLTAADIFLA